MTVFTKQFVDALANHLEVYIVDFLGEGIFGSAYELSDGFVLKVTEDWREAACVEPIFDVAAWNLTPHLPMIKQYGWFQKKFYYIREALWNIEDENDPLTWEEQQQWKELAFNSVIKIESIIGVGIEDWESLENWGLRIHPDGGADVVWRDLSCK